MTSSLQQSGSLALGDVHYQVATFDDRTLEQTLSLLRVCFPRAAHFTADFLDWLYRANPVGAPVGYNALIGDQIVGHLVGIPERIRLHGKPVTALLFCNVATHPDCRGKGLFLELAKKTAIHARDLGHAAIIGVANQNTIRGYEQRLGWQNVAGLHARLCFGSEGVDMARALDLAQLHREWDDETLHWRMANPCNPLRVFLSRDAQLVVTGRTPYPGLSIRATIPRAGLDVGSLPTMARRALTLSVGLLPTGTATGAYLPIPDKLRPSPLRLIFKDLVLKGRKLDSHAILFSFLDFDAF